MGDSLTLKLLPLALALIIAIFLTHWSENAHFMSKGLKKERII